MTFSWVEGDGKYVIIASIVSEILMYLNKEKLSLIPTAIAGFLFLYDGSQILSNYLEIGFGFFIILIGLVGMVIYPLTLNKDANNNFNQTNNISNKNLNQNSIPNNNNNQNSNLNNNPFPINNNNNSKLIIIIIIVIVGGFFVFKL